MTTSAEQRARELAKVLLVIACLVFWLVGMGVGLSWWRAGLLALFGVVVNGLLLLGGPPLDQREHDDEDARPA